MKKRFVTALSVLLMFCILAMQATAVSVPDLSRTGSVSISFVYEQEPVAGGSLTLYRVADVQVENGADYSFRLTGEFAGSGVALDALAEPQTAAALAEYAGNNALEGITLQISEDGKVSFRELELGLYLLIQQEAAEGFEELSPFLVTVPSLKNGEYIYDVDASPKLALVPAPTEPTQPTEPTEPPPPDLPQTGLVQWPVPVLTVGGLLLVVLGWSLCASGRKKENEK